MATLVDVEQELQYNAIGQLSDVVHSPEKEREGDT